MDGKAGTIRIPVRSGTDRVWNPYFMENYRKSIRNYGKFKERFKALDT